MDAVYDILLGYDGRGEKGKRGEDFGYKSHYWDSGAKRRDMMVNEGVKEGEVCVRKWWGKHGRRWAGGGGRGSERRRRGWGGSTEIDDRRRDGEEMSIGCRGKGQLTLDVETTRAGNVEKGRGNNRRGGDEDAGGVPFGTTKKKSVVR
jgi:hypothetical protein